jgi:cell shape-determining protein MreC
MKTYSSRAKTTLRRKRSLLVGALVVAVVILSAPVIRSGTFFVLGMPLRAASGAYNFLAAGSAGFVSSIALSEENRVLRHRIAALEGEVARSAGVVQQYNDLVESLGRSTHASSTLAGAKPHLIASVLARPPRTPFDVFGIDAGRAEGVSEGDRVGYEGIVLGVVDTVDEHTAAVRLFSSPQSSMTVRIGSVDVEAVGQGGGRIRLQAPKGETIVAGDPVLLPALSLDLVGIVQLVESPENDAFQTAYFGAPVSLSEIRYVSLYRSI